jgi:peptidoglycan-associated lipoprotein
MKRLHTLYAVLGISVMLSSCAGLYLKSGKTAYEEYRYDEAARLLEKGLAKKEDSEYRLMLAKTNMQLGRYQEAATSYSLATAAPTISDAERLEFGKALLASGEYDRAAQVFDGILSRNQGHPEATALASACRNVEKMKRDSSLYKVELVNISGLAAVYAPFKTEEGLIVSAEKSAPGVKDPYTSLTYTDLYLVKKNGANYDAPVKLDGLNGAYHEATAVIAPDKNTMYLSRSNYDGKRLGKDGENTSNLQLNYSIKNENGDWSAPAPLPFNDAHYTFVHPTLSADGKTMYFSSDMQGGFGGMDLYMTQLEATNWSKPVNLGPSINTSGDDVFPFLKSADSLYFSSDAHAGLGGKDILYSVKRGGNWSAPYHLSYPINTAADDFGVSIDANGKTGYLSSNRDGSDKIYSFEIFNPELAIQGLVADKMSMLPVKNAKITLMNITDGTEEVFYSDENGEFRIPLLPGKNYRVKVDEENYFSNTQEISTMNKTKSEEIPVIFELEKLIVTEKEVQTPEVVITEEEQQKVKDGTYAVPNIYWDYNKWNIRADAEPYLDDLVKKFKDNPKLKVELRSHCDSRGSDPFNDELSQKRADAVVEYLVAKGVKRSMFVSKGFGKRKLINRCKDGVECSEEEHQQNRRTEFVVLKK